MPLSLAGGDVIIAIGDIMASLPKTQEDTLVYHAGVQWAKVASAFFRNGTVPKWGPGALQAGEQAFAAVATPVIAGWPALGAAFMAYAAVAMVPGGTVPVALSAPPVPPVFLELETMGAMPDHRSGATALFKALYAWAKTGAVIGPLPWE